MNTRTFVKAHLGAQLLFSLASIQPCLAQQTSEDETSFFLLFGGQHRNDVGTRGIARFNEFRDVPTGAVIDFLRFEWTPSQKDWTLSLTAMDALQEDQRYFVELTRPAAFSFKLNYRELPRFYSSGSTTLWSGVGTDTLTLNDAFRLGAESAAGSPTAVTAPPALDSLMRDALSASGQSIDLRTQRQGTDGSFDYKLSTALSFNVLGRYEEREGVKPLSVGTYIRRQALPGIPNTGPGNFWRETIEPRGQELAEPVNEQVSELGASLTWAQKGHSVAAGWLGSWFRNDTPALYFDNPFEAVVGRASANTFNPASDQEPPAPNGNNNFRGLYARSAIQLWPDNSYNQLFGNGSFKLGGKTRFNAALSYATMEQNEPFLPYAENNQVVFSGVAGQPGVVYAKDAPLPRSSLDGQIHITRADLKLTSHPTKPLSFRLGYRIYDYQDDSAEIFFPGYSSSSDSYFRRGIGQKNDQGQAVLFNHVGGYDRQRFNGGLAYRIGSVTLDGEYFRTRWNYDVRQVDRTTEDAFKATVRYLAAGGITLNAHYLHANRDFDGPYSVGLETSGVRAYDVWARDRDQTGIEVNVPVREKWTVGFGGSYARDQYPGAVEGFAQPYGLQETKNASIYGGLGYGAGDWNFGVWTGWDGYEWDSLQVTKTGLRKDYDPTNRWTRESLDDVFWVGFDVAGPIASNIKLRADVNYQNFSGEWNTTNLGSPDVNSAVAYAFPELDEKTLQGRASLLWTVNPSFDFEIRYWYEPYR